MFESLLLTLLTLVPTNESGGHGAYTQWRANDDVWVRVGLKEPQRVPVFSSAGPVLVLDGDKVVQTISPKGEFRVISAARSGPQYWVQIRAAYNVRALERTRETVAAKYPDYEYAIVDTENRFKALRVGPAASRADSEALRKRMVEQGFSDAFVVKTGGSTWAWVNRNFDKERLRAVDLALVRANPDEPIRFKGTPYRGILRLRVQGGNVRVINVLPLETYLRGVVPSELGPRVFPELEALKAQAVAARTYVLKNMGRFSRRGYDICDGPACQAYDGMKNEMALSDEAVRATQGQVLYHEGELIDALYTSTSGGHTADVEAVFPGRSEPYLRGKSEYLADFKQWTLPGKSLPGKRPDPQHEHLAVEALLYGFPELPDLKGTLDAASLATMLDRFAWVLGKPASLPQGRVNAEAFWQTLARLPFVQDTITHQMHPDDTTRLLRDYPIPPELGAFAALTLRYELVSPADLATFGSKDPLSKARAMTYLLQFCKGLGPVPEWRRYLVENVTEGKIVVRAGLNRYKEIEIGQMRAYLMERNDVYRFIEAPVIEERDRIYLLAGPFPANLLKLRQNGGVASVDRFSVYDYWLEKKDIDTLEKRARRYVRGMRGIQDVKVLTRNDHGRVTKLRFIARNGTYDVTGLNIRWSLGIRDNLFEMLPQYKNGKLVHVTFMGRGWGHGVGMSQVGAYGLARMGWTFDEILKYYYTGVELKAYQSKDGS